VISPKLVHFIPNLLFFGFLVSASETFGHNMLHYVTDAWEGEVIEAFARNLNFHFLLMTKNKISLNNHLVNNTAFRKSNQQQSHKSKELQNLWYNMKLFHFINIICTCTVQVSNTLHLN